jgi:hypothetical protein
MPKQTNEDIKKHGDTMEPLIERTGGSSAPGKRGANQDPAELQDDDDEDLQNDDVDDERDVGESD